MGESLKSDKTIRDYLLGRVSDETRLEGIEELLFTDEDFCSQVALEEDGIINEYVFGKLTDEDAEDFRKTLKSNPDRRFKLMLTEGLRERAFAHQPKPAEVGPSFFTSLASWFHQPKYVGAFAVLLILVVAFAVYFNTRSSPDQLAELRSIYQQGRPTQTRISEFGYAPLTELRGAPEASEQRRLRLIQNNLLNATEANPNAQTHHALGVYYLTQKHYQDAIKEFENALKFANNKAQIHNDLGVAHFELSKTGPREKKFEELARSLEEFTKATELDGNLLEALFNKSLALQDLGMSREAKESWTLYLQKDTSSPWAEEARKNLARLESEQVLFRTDKQVLSDFLTAYRDRNYPLAEKIHNETKGLLLGPTIPLQLTRQYLLARQSGHEADAGEAIEALTFLGTSEQKQNGESFFFELASFYAGVGPEKFAPLLEAKEVFVAGELLIGKAEYLKAISQLERSRDLFARLGNQCEAAVAESWAVQLLSGVGKVAEGRKRAAALMSNAESRQFKVLLPPSYYWLAMSDYRQIGLSQSKENLKTALRLAESTHNVFEIQHAQDALALHYSELGELEPALAYAGKMLTVSGVHYQNDRQWLRNLGTMAEIALKLKFYATSLSLSREALGHKQERYPATSGVHDSLRHMSEAAAGKGDLTDALKHANDSLQILLNLSDKEGNTGPTAAIYLLRADLKSRANCREALPDYDKALELYGRLSEFTVNSYQIHKGKLFCFQKLNEQDNFSRELEAVLKLSEKYRTTIREDDSRQAFFANEQSVFDAAVENAIQAHDSRRAFDFIEESRARSLLDFVESEKAIAEVEKTFGPVARPLSLAEVQARLPEQVELLQYAVLPDTLAIWIVSKTRFDLVEKRITVGELEKKVEAHRAAIIAKAPSEEIKESGRELYELLIPSGLTPNKHLCLVPDKSLHQLAFATLVSHDGKYLLEHHPLMYAPSASVLVMATENARGKTSDTSESLLSVGNPEFDHDDNPNLTDLQSAEAEAKSIASGYSKPL
ncbi:MAG TPA: CHAT domain-containing protein, partial [Pyrinomonadaceae bacterium]|nr:CHAT domain-containing protein [Pyrinomonadaceae bacterium]